MLLFKAHQVINFNMKYRQLPIKMVNQKYLNNCSILREITLKKVVSRADSSH